MIINKVGAFVVGALIAAVLLALAAPTAAQSGTSVFVIAFERSGPPQIDEDTGAVIPNTGGLFNPCTAELVDVTGSSTISIAQKVDAKNNLTTNVSIVTKGSGVGQTSLTVYPFTETQSFFLKEALGTLVESEFIDKISMKGPGKIDNWIVRARFRIKIAPDGTVQINLVRLNDGDQCKG